MARLIDADKLPYENQVISHDDEWCLKVSDIENAPTVDAVEVVHSQFRKSNEEIENYGHCYSCIECGATMMVEDKKFHDTAPNWCALCGAKMDREMDREMDSNLLFADMEEIIDATD